MEKQTSNIRQSSMFLIELIIAVLFLSLCSAICVRLFVNARLMEKSSYELTQSVTAAQNIAEVFEGGVSREFKPVLPTATSQYVSATDYMAQHFAGSEPLQLAGILDSYKDAPVLTIFYDEQFQVCSSDSYSYAAYVFMDYHDNMISADIFVKHGTESSDFNQEDSIYSLHVDQAYSSISSNYGYAKGGAR